VIKLLRTIMAAVTASVLESAPLRPFVLFSKEFDNLPDLDSVREAAVRNLVHGGLLRL
jgi:hypothetical protein